MNNYTVFVDSSCDIPQELLDNYGLHTIELTFRFTDSPEEFRNCDLDIDDFYRNLREGRDAKTAAINAEQFKLSFEPELEAGRDVLYIGFSSGLSTTYNQSRMAAAELAKKYPERRVLTADSLCESSGYGMIVMLAMKKLAAGASLEETVEYIESTRLSICHWFTVDDLQFLHRGGRVGAVAAFVGTAIGIKPILHVDNDGKLINLYNVRGRKKAVRELAKKLRELRVDGDDSPIYISHGDCREDADELAHRIKELCGADVDVISPIGPVIGSHSGPGTLAVFFVGSER